MSELIKRTLYGFIFVVLIIGGLLVSSHLFALIMLLIVGIGSLEMIELRLNPKMDKSNTRLVVVLNAAMYMLMALIALNLLPLKFLILTLLLMLSPFLHALFSKRYNFSELAGIYWPAFFLVALPAGMMIMLLEAPYFGHIGGPYLLLSVLVMVWVNDVFAYLVGIKIGKHRLFERVSPKKSWEGSIGGLVFTLITAATYSYFTNFIDLANALAIASIVVVFGSLGDLIESMLKRQAGVKDSGKIIPGHGGILDRFDATFYAIPFVFIYLILFL